MHTATFDLPLVAACIAIVAAVILLIATQRAEGRKRLSIIALCAGFLVSGLWHLLGLKGEDGALPWIHLQRFRGRSMGTRLGGSMNGSWTSPVLNVAVLIQIAGVTRAFGHSPIGIAAMPLGVALLILGGVVYRRELKRRRSIADRCSFHRSCSYSSFS